MSKRISYRPLIDKWEAFLETNQGQTVEDFARFVLQQKKGVEEESNHSIDDDGNITFNYPYLAPEAGQAIFRLYKFSKIYSRPIMQSVGLHSFDEFAVLTTLLTNKEMTKNQLIHQNLIELTTGMDMLKRMLKHKLIKERVNPEDKRARLVSLSEEGRKAVFEILESFQTMEDILGDMNKKEREEIIGYLDRLDAYHSSLNSEGT